MLRYISDSTTKGACKYRLWRRFSSSRDLRLIRFKELPSTHTVCQTLLPLVHASDESRLDVCVMADRQTQGITSKAGYTWKHESNASLAASLGFSFLVGYAAVNALKDLYQVEDIALKWPNDIYFRGHKCGGILTSLLPAPLKEAKTHLLYESLKSYFDGATQDSVIKGMIGSQPSHQASSRELGTSNLDYILLIGVGINIAGTDFTRGTSADSNLVELPGMNQFVSYLPSHVDKIMLTQHMHGMIGKEIDELESEFILPAHWMSQIRRKYEPLMLWKGDKVNLMSPQESSESAIPVATGVLQGLNEYGGANVLQEDGQIFKTSTRMTMRKATD